MKSERFYKQRFGLTAEKAGFYTKYFYFITVLLKTTYHRNYLSSQNFSDAQCSCNQYNQLKTDLIAGLVARFSSKEARKT